MIKYFGFNHVQWPQSECQRFFGDGDDNTDDGCDVDDENDVDDIFDENDVYGDKCGTLILLGKVSNDDLYTRFGPSCCRRMRHSRCKCTAFSRCTHPRTGTC